MKSTFWKSFGPGLLWAAAAIGVSHLVQATRAGAMAGFSLWWVILLALVLKYPFFEYGPRYAAATGESLVEGYRRIGRWAVWVYLLLALAMALIVQVAVVLFTSFLIQLVFGITWSETVVGAGVLAACIALLAVGRYRLLDIAIKVVLALLAVSTLVAAAVSVPRIDVATLVPWPLVERDAVEFPFLLALVGWMPSGFNLSVWSSLWTLAKNRDTGTQASVRHALLDFRIGYVGSGVLAFAFVALGAAVMHGSGENLSSEGPGLSVQLVDLYVRALGGWARPVVVVAVLTTMFSTVLTVVDGFPRALARAIRALAAADRGPGPGDTPTYWAVVGVLAVLTLVVMALFIGSFTAMIDFATTVSFLAAPVLGYLNLRAVRAPHVPLEHQPGRALVALSYTGLALLGATTAVYLVSLVVRGLS